MEDKGGPIRTLPFQNGKSGLAPRALKKTTSLPVWTHHNDFLCPARYLKKTSGFMPERKVDKVLALYTCK